MSKTHMLAAAGLVFASAWPATAQDTSIEHVRALMAQADQNAATEVAATSRVSTFSRCRRPSELRVHRSICRSRTRWRKRWTRTSTSPWRASPRA